MNHFFWKISGVNNLSDARFFNALDEAWIEFVFDKENERFITTEQANAISGWLFEPNLLASFNLNHSEEEIFHTMKATFSQFASVPIEHSLTSDVDFMPLAFIKLTNQQLQKALALKNKPYAFIINNRNIYSSEELKIIQLLQQESKIFLSLSDDIEVFKDQISIFEQIGIELPSIEEQSPGCGAVDAYHEIMESLES